MDKIRLLGSSFSCSCGKDHSVPTRYLLYSEDAFQQLPEIAAGIANSGNWLLIADKRTYSAAGKAVEQAIKNSGIEAKVFIVSDYAGESPVADDRTRDEILNNGPDADLYISVGSGVINDLTKWVAFLRKKPYITVATAASMNGYASANVAATIDGLKVLFHASAPLAIFSAPSLLSKAPHELTTSGLGDVLAKSVSSADWKLNKLIFDDYFCQFSVDLLKELEPVYLDNPEGIRTREPEAIKALFEALFFSSVAMTITGTSSPASGGEHLLSHTLDMLAGRDDTAHDYHGRQVGVCSILMAALYAEIMKIDQPRFVKPQPDISSSFWGSLSPVVSKEYQQKLPKCAAATTYFSQTGNWQKFKDEISQGLVSPQRLKDCLAKAGGAHRICDIRDNGHPLTREKFKAIALNANQMRSRFTVLDIASLLGLMDRSLDDLIDRWLIN